MKKMLNIEEATRGQKKKNKLHSQLRTYHFRKRDSFFSLSFHWLYWCTSMGIYGSLNYFLLES